MQTHLQQEQKGFLHWDPKKQRLHDQSDQEETTSMQLSLIENKISKAFLMLLGHSKMATTQQSYGKIVQRKRVSK